MVRAWEILSERISPSRPISLRALHKIGQRERRHQEFEANRRALMSVMYAIDDPRDVEFERRELELDQREVDLDKREAELDLIQQKIEQSTEARDVVRKMARHAIESDDT